MFLKDKKLPKKVTDEYKKMFDLVDLDKNGTLEFSEITQLLKDSLNNEEIIEFFKKADKDDSGEIDF